MKEKNIVITFSDYEHNYYKNLFNTYETILDLCMYNDLKLDDFINEYKGYPFIINIKVSPKNDIFYSREDIINGMSNYSKYIKEVYNKNKEEFFYFSKQQFVLWIIKVIICKIAASYSVVTYEEYSDGEYKQSVITNDVPIKGISKYLPT